MIKNLKKYKSIILYIVFGVTTTLVNIITYFICTRILKNDIIISNVVAWCFAVLFAYVTNRKWVFESENNSKSGVLKELIYFISCRLTTGLIDLIIMYISVNILNFNDIFMKIISNLIVIIVNYLASKFIVFKKK